jgi:hypothetical protein
MQPSSTRGSEGYVHRIVLLSLARRALENGSSISLSGNLHPQLTSRNPPCTSGDRTSHFRESGGQASCLLISETRKQSTLTLSFPILDFSLSRFRQSRCQATRSLGSRNPICRNSDALASFDFSTTPLSVGTSDFVISRILMQRIQVFTPRNPEMVNGV